ncbi:MAG: DUF485 domain-containing protein [Hyphomicrobium sp.]|nr:DUF485 domain-containing protein [Hyphomicrobium sp.]
MSSIEDPTVARVWRDPEFHAYMSRRGRFSWFLALLTVIVYFGFIAIVAFAPATLAAPVGDGVMSLGILVGLVVILFSVAVTWIYVLRANTAFDRAVAAIRERNQ